MNFAALILKTVLYRISSNKYIIALHDPICLRKQTNILCSAWSRRQTALSLIPQRKPFAWTTKYYSICSYKRVTCGLPFSSHCVSWLVCVFFDVLHENQRFDLHTQKAFFRCCWEEEQKPRCVCDYFFRNSLRLSVLGSTHLEKWRCSSLVGFDEGINRNICTHKRSVSYPMTLGRCVCEKL